MNINAITTTPEAQKGFYPTPPELADKLLAGIDWDYIGTVLEPSAGKGDLVKAVAQKANSRRYGEPLNVDCVEIDPYLHSILEYEFGGKRENEIWERLNGPGSCLWASEIDEFAVAVTKFRFGKDE